MRKTGILLLLSTLVLGCVPYSAAQVIPTLSGRVAIAIVIEGADYRVLADVDTPNLDALAREGAWTNNSLTTLPSSSTTAHASLATGAYPEVTCVVNTVAVNATEYHIGTATEPEKTYDYLELLNATTLIETANLHGVHTAVIVGEKELNVTLGKTQVAERYRVLDISVTADYDEWIANETIIAIEDFNATVKRGEDLLMLVSMPATKWVGYEYGPSSEEYKEALKNADLQVGRIVNRTKELELWNNTLLFVTADHGMVTTERDKNVLKTEEHRWPGPVLGGIYHWIIDAGGKAAHIYLKDPSETQKAVNDLWDSGVVDLIYSRVSVEEVNGTLGKWWWRDVHLDGTYSGDLFVILKPGYQYWQGNLGAHGSWDTQRVPLYIAGGRKTKAGYTLKGQPEIIDIAPTVATFLGIPVPEKSQGRILMEAFFTPFAETAISASPAILFPGDTTQFNVSFSIAGSTENITLKNYILDEEGGVVKHVDEWDYPVNKSSEVKNFNWTANETGTYMITSYLSLSINGEEYVISWTQSKLLVIEKVEPAYPLMQVVAACIIGIVPSILVIWVSFKYKSRQKETAEQKKKK